MGGDGSLVGRSITVVPNGNGIAMVAYHPQPISSHLTPRMDEIFNEQTPLVTKQNAELKGIWSFLRVIVLVVLCIGSIALMVTLAVQKTADGRSHFPFSSYPMHSDTDDIPSSSLRQPGDCLGPPYLYVSLHDKFGNILKYSRDGCLMDDAVLLMSEAYTKSAISDVEFRLA